MLRSPLLAAAAALALATAGCASVEPAPPAQAGSDSEQVCKREFPSFSAIAVTKCRSRAEIAADQAKASEAAAAIRDTSKSLKDPVTGR